ncbi:SMP-30/gluconolactonase/LRE family protein [Gluconobacter morbifer]|uniref:SMP-30/Gluconolaconase/LRE-like region-containing protein n=1 Tax=Gluconobacter morbifer G707 TaxID=1088869 RepID=G6XJ53_9PROT|nr:SMP-30/gluconolactonase/LRE family protein [Gluconobacter morbifer]EHH68169.1 SMP-30/Gluconolaconase/LRE-like region-containing protein [Gluconobacter morbifer G707]
MKNALTGTILRHAGLPSSLGKLRDIRMNDPSLAAVLDFDTPLLVLHEGTTHGEGPVWDQARNRLVWSDVISRRLMAWHPDGRVHTIIDPTWFMNGNALLSDGIMAHCEHGRRCISLSSGEGEALPAITHYQGGRLNSPNDIVTGAQDTIWFTDPVFGIHSAAEGYIAEPELPHRSVYRYRRRTGELTRMADFDQPNGLAFSQDGRTLYVSDTSRAIGGGTHHIFAFDVRDDGHLDNQRTLYETAKGVPDGFAVDARNWIWTTAGDGIHILDLNGVCLGFIPLPEVPANCTFGGTNGRRFFIATKTRLLAIDLRI